MEREDYSHSLSVCLKKGKQSSGARILLIRELEEEDQVKKIFMDVTW